MHSRRTGDGVSWFLTGLYSLTLMVLLLASEGNTDRIVWIQGPFSWHVVLLVILMCDFNRYNMHNASISWAKQTLVKIVAVLCAMLQSLGFAIWAAVVWGEQGADVLPFYPVIVTVLGVQTLITGAIAVALGSVDLNHHDHRPE